MAHHDSDQERPGRILDLDVPGDTNSGDIVDRTGEQMPREGHDGVDEDRRSTRVNDEETDVRRRRHEDGFLEGDHHDNPRVGKISDW